MNVFVGVRGRQWVSVCVCKRMCSVLASPIRHKSAKRPANENVTVAYYFCGEPIPYRTSVREIGRASCRERV